MRRTAIALALIGFFIVPAQAQTPPPSTPMRVRGTVEKLDGQNLTVKSRDGQSLTIALAANVIVSYLTKKTAACRIVDKTLSEHRASSCSDGQ